MTKLSLLFNCVLAAALAQTQTSLERYRLNAENALQWDTRESDERTLSQGNDRLTLRAATAGTTPFGAASDVVCFGILGRGVFCAADENNDGFADIVRFMFRQRVFPTNIVVLTDSDRTMFVTDINGKVYKLTDQTGSGLADAKFREYFVPATDAILPLTADAFWLGSASYPNALLSQLEMNGQRISLPSSDSTPGAGRSIISMAKGQNDSLYLVDMIEGVLRRIPNTTPFSFLDWSRPAIMTKEYPTAVKVASDGRGRIFLLIAGVDRFLPPEPSSGPQAPPQTISVQSKIVVFRETSGALVREQEIIPGLGPWQVPFSPFNGLAVKGENVYAISTTYSQDGPVSEIHRINLQTKQATRFLSTYDVGNVLLTGLAVMGN